MNGLKRLRSSLSRALDVPAGATGERLFVSTGGFYYTTVEGCAAIVDYSPCRVILDCGKNRVIIEGEGLSVGAFSMAQVRIHGRVDSITNERCPL